MGVQSEPKIDFVPAKEFVVDDFDTLKVLADPLRIRILDFMRDPCTVKQVAAELDILPTKLYYHINQLEKHGLIVLVETRIVSGIIEKHYQTAAYMIRVQRQLLSPSPDEETSGLELTVSSLWQNAMQNLRASSAQGIIDTSGDGSQIDPSTVNLRSVNFSLSAEQATEFLTRYRALLSEFQDLSDEQYSQKDDEIQSYRLFTLMFPMIRNRPAQSDSDT